MVGKVYGGILVDRVRSRVTEGLIYDEEGSFRLGRSCVDQIFTVKQIGRGSAVIVPLYKGKGERTECKYVWKNIYRDLSR